MPWFCKLREVLLKIMCLISANYAHHFFHFVLLISGILETKSTCKLIYTRESRYSAKTDINQRARITYLMQ